MADLTKSLKGLELYDATIDNMLVGQRGNLHSGNVPFVNRYREVAELLAVNAIAIHEATTEPRAMDDYRGLKVAVASQMFGAGKTTLGRRFIEQLNNETAQDHIGTYVRALYPHHVDVIFAEWERARKAILVRVDLTLGQDFSGALRAIHKSLANALKDVTLPAFNSGNDTALQRQFVEWLMMPREQPVFLFLDEVGVLEADELRLLRDCIHLLWVNINNSKDPSKVPATYFLLAGKGVSVSQLASRSAPVGTHWIVLGPLHLSHISEVRRGLHKKDELVLNGLTDDAAEYLDKQLKLWTGGYPRLLLYTFRGLKLYKGYGYPDFSTKEGIDECILRVRDWLMRLPAVANELFIPTGASDDLTEAWFRLLVLAQLRVPCSVSTRIQVPSGATFDLDTLLRALNVFIAPLPPNPSAATPVTTVPVNRLATADDAKGTAHQFLLHSVGYAVHLVQERFGDFHVGLVLGNGPSLGLSYSLLLEQVVELRLLINIAMATPSATWGEVCPFLKGTTADKLIPELTTKRIQSMPEVRATKSDKKQQEPQLADEDLILEKSIEAKDLARMMLAAPPNIYRPQSDKSKSCDTAVPQRNCHIEFQDKAYRKADLGVADLDKEVKKRAQVEQRKPVVLVVLALRLGAALSRAVGTRDALVLERGYYAPTSSNDGLLHRRGKTGRWKTVIRGGMSTGTGNLTQGAKPTLYIPHKVQVVLAKPKAVEEFVGRDCAELLLAEAHKPPVLSAETMLRFFECGKARSGDTQDEKSGAKSRHGDMELVCLQDNNVTAAVPIGNRADVAGGGLQLKLVDQDGDTVPLHISARTITALRTAAALELEVEAASITKCKDGTVIRKNQHVQCLEVHQVLTVTAWTEQTS